MLAPPGGAFRHERKFVLPPLSQAEADHLVASLPGRFHPAFPDRHVNSIYYDAEDLPLLRENADSQKERVKVRIRWYGPLEGVARPTLEFKVKRGPLGRKVSFALPETAVVFPCAGADLHAIALALRPIPLLARELLAPLRPAIAIRYGRAYFASACGGFRLTVDRDLTAFDPAGRPLATPAAPRTVFEFKYGVDRDGEARSIVSTLPARLARHSKYVVGFGG